MLKYDHFQKKNNTIIALLAIAALASCGEFLWLGGAEIRQAAGNERAAILADGGSHLKQKLLKECY